MRPTHYRSRRTLLYGAGCVISTGVLAGCTDGMGDGGDDAERDDDIVDTADDADPSDTGWEDEWADVDTIELEAHADEGWIGRRPAVIDGIENPDLALYAGDEYEFVVSEIHVDGEPHNFAIWDDESEPLVSSSFAEDELTLEVEAREEMELYLCETHERTMVGTLEIRTE